MFQGTTGGRGMIEGITGVTDHLVISFLIITITGEVPELFILLEHSNLLDLCVFQTVFLSFVSELLMYWGSL